MTTTTAPPALSLLTKTWDPRSQADDYRKALLCAHPDPADNAWLKRGLRDLLLYLHALAGPSGVTPPVDRDALHVAVGIGDNERLPAVRAAIAMGALSAKLDDDGDFSWPPCSERFGGHVFVLGPLPVGPQPADWTHRSRGVSTRVITKAERKRQKAQLQALHRVAEKKGGSARTLTPEARAAKRKKELERAEAMDAYFNHLPDGTHARYSMRRIIAEADAWRAANGLPELSAFELSSFYLDPIKTLVSAGVNVAHIRAALEVAVKVESHKAPITGTTGRFGRHVKLMAERQAAMAAAGGKSSVWKKRKAEADPAEAARQKAKEILEEARTANREGRDNDARPLLDDALALVPALAPLFGGSEELADAHLRLAYKKGTSDFESAPEAIALHDWYEGWDWPEHLEAGA